MIIAGAGGHALELIDILIEEGIDDDLYFFDEVTDKKWLLGKYRILSTEAEVMELFKVDPRFILGIGSPNLRAVFYSRFKNLGGCHLAIQSSKARISSFASFDGVDVFSGCFLGPNTHLGIGSLLNTGSQVHHDVVTGEFVEISPCSILLGAVVVGDSSVIGTSATVLPKIKIGKNVIIGAGSVVTKDIPDGETVVGVPGRFL